MIITSIAIVGRASAYRQCAKMPFVPALCTLCDVRLRGSGLVKRRSVVKLGEVGTALRR